MISRISEGGVADKYRMDCRSSAGFAAARSARIARMIRNNVASPSLSLPVLVPALAFLGMPWRRNLSPYS
jgi:hypothetical protein